MTADSRYPDARRRPGRPALTPADVVDHHAGIVDGMEPGRRWITIRQIATDLGVSTSTVYKWSCQGPPNFPRSIRLRNGELRVRVDWYEEWLTGLEQPI